MNTENTFTPGPWKISKVLSDKHRFAIVNEGIDQHLIAEVVKNNINNAHLIAAAPDMYVALKNTCSTFLLNIGMEPSDKDHWYNIAKAAIAKAENNYHPA